MTTPQTSDQRTRLRPDELSAVLRAIGDIDAIDYFPGGTFASVARVVLSNGMVVAVKCGPRDGSPMLTHEQGMLRAEHELLEMARTHPALRLPRLLVADFTRAIVEVDVLVTDVLPGHSWDACGNAMTHIARTTSEFACGQVMGSFNAIHGDRFGFVSARAPEYSSQSWFTTFARMVATVVDDGESHGLDMRRDEVVDAVDRHAAALEQVEEPRLLHGDLWRGNVLVQPTTGRVHGVIDPERALWGDPLFDVAGFLQGSHDPAPRALAAGYESRGAVIDTSREGRARLDLYLLWFALCMLAETGPRGFSPTDRRARAAWLGPQISHLLTRLR